MKLAIFAAAAAVACAGTTIDTADPIDDGAARCFASNGISQGIVRIGHSNGAFDSNSVGSINALRNAGLSVAGYAWPCVGTDPGSIASGVMGGLRSNGVSVSTVWIDVEPNPDCPYDAAPALRGANATAPQVGHCDYIDKIVSAFQSQGVPVGIYSSPVDWGNTVGSGCTSGAGSPVWYSHYETPPQPNFNDWQSFGAFSSPSMKQYQGTDSLCGVGVDRSWSP